MITDSANSADFVDSADSEQDKIRSQLAAHFTPFFSTFRNKKYHILTFRNKKYRISTFRNKKYHILTFRSKKYRILTFRNKTESYLKNRGNFKSTAANLFY